MPKSEDATQKITPEKAIASKDPNILIVPNSGMKDFYQQALLVMGFIGGFSFAALVLVLGGRTQFYVTLDFFEYAVLSPQYYYPLLTTSLSVLSIVCVFGSVYMAQTGSLPVTYEMMSMANRLYTLSMTGTVYVLSLLVWHSSTLGAIATVLLGLYLNNRFLKSMRNLYAQMNSLPKASVDEIRAYYNQKESEDVSQKKDEEQSGGPPMSDGGG